MSFGKVRLALNCICRRAFGVAEEAVVEEGKGDTASQGEGSTVSGKWVFVDSAL